MMKENLAMLVGLRGKKNVKRSILKDRPQEKRERTTIHWFTFQKVTIAMASPG